MDGILHPGEELTINQPLPSSNGIFGLLFQGDGNLIVVANWGEPLWFTSTQGQGAAKAVMQGDGNFVIYTASGKAIWSTNTWGHNGAFVRIQDDGLLVIRGSGDVGTLWNSGVRTLLSDYPREMARRVIRWKKRDRKTNINAVDMQCSGISVNPHYNQPQMVSSTWGNIDNITYNNCSSTQDTQTWNSSKSTQDTVSVTNKTTFTVTRGFSLSLPISGVPGASGGTTETFTYSTETTNAQTTQITQTRTQTTQVLIPPHSKIELAWRILNNEYFIDFTMDIRAIDAVVQLQGFPPFLPIRLDDWLTPAEQTFHSTGTIHGVFGTQLDIDKIQKNPDCGAPIQLPGPDSEEFAKAYAEFVAKQSSSDHGDTSTSSADRVFTGRFGEQRTAAKQGRSSSTSRS